MRQRRPIGGDVAPPGAVVGDPPVEGGGSLGWIARQFLAPGARRWAMRALAVASVGSVACYVLWYARWGGHEVDLAVYLMGASHVTSAHLYSLRLAQLGLDFTYTPFAAVVFTPLTIFSARVAEAIWGLLNVVALVAILYATIRAIHPSGRRDGARWTAMLIAGPFLGMEPVLSTLSFGQVNLVLAAFILVDLTSIRRFGGPLSRRGVLVGIAAAVKLTPLIFVPWLFFTRQVRAGWTAIWSFLACSAIGFAVTPRSSVTWWSKDVFMTSRVGGVAYITNQDLQVVIGRFRHALVSGPLISVLIALVGAAGLALAVLAYRHTSTPRSHHRELHLHGLQLVSGNSFFFAIALFLLGVAAMLLTRSRRSQRRADAAHDRDVRAAQVIAPTSGGAVQSSA